MDTVRNGDRQQRRILVVDDEPSIVDAVATALRYEGYDVDEATTGRQALATVAAHEPDLIVLDWMLPDLEGIEVGRRLRARRSAAAAAATPARRTSSTLSHEPAAPAVHSQRILSLLSRSS